jgi:hypothetical protein
MIDMPLFDDNSQVASQARWPDRRIFHVNATA